MNAKNPDRKASTSDIFNYAVGEGANSVAMNSWGSFGLLYLTLIIGLDPIMAGLAVSISIFWDAITDPLMGHLSDNTRSRWGRRHIYVLIGGLATAAIFLSYWTVPQLLESKMAAFAMVLLLNLLIRTALTVFVVPYTALGFEICPEYDMRAKLQGIRFFLNQIVNFVFGALAWPLFFKDTVNEATGETINGSQIAGNYNAMGITLSMAIVAATLYCCFSTRRFATDNRDHPKGHNDLKAFWKDFSSIFKDRLAIFVFIFTIIAQFSMGLMAQTQMYTYVFFMEFTPWEKTFSHGGGMIAFALVSLNLSKVVHRFDKKKTGLIGMCISMFGGFGLWAVFSTGLMAPGAGPFELFGQPFHASTIVFGILQMCWWGGCGLVIPLSTSMVADVAAINAKKNGTEVRNASYASVFSFSQKASFTITGVLIASMISISGFVSGAGEQTPEAIRNIANLTFLSGPIVLIFAALMLSRYPVTRKMVAQYEQGESDA